MLIDLPLWLFYVMLACTIGFPILIVGLLWATSNESKKKELKFLQNFLKSLNKELEALIYRKSAYSQFKQYEKDLRKWK